MSQLKESHLYIPFKDIEIATKNFEESECIGRGGYGRVYKGKLFISGKQTTVAIKRLNENLGQGLKEFLTEIQLLSGQMHPNLISLLGYCDEGKEKIIVYEYAERGSLNRYIQRHNTTHTLTWLERLKICVHAARGLEFLHNHVGKHQSIIHRDIKSANILIDQNWDAKISDLGLSKLSLAGLNRSTVVSHVCGTPGYCEPEYFETGIVKKESDIYSFGMVLFEVLCGRLCLVKDDDDFSLSVRLIKDYYQRNKLDEIIDPVLKNQSSSECLEKFSAIAYGCLLDKREQRPPIKLVVKELEELMKIQEPKLAPVKYHGVEHLSVMLTDCGQNSDPLDIPLPELQNLKTLKVVFHHAKKDEVVTHTITLPKQRTVQDLLNDLKTKVELSNRDAELRLLSVFYHTITRVIPLNEEIEHINNSQLATTRAEEVPEEEKKLGPQDHVIQVRHFMIDEFMNQYILVQYFGEPFLLVICEGETLAEVKVRIQKKLQLPDEKFSKWRFAFLDFNVHKSLQDSDIVSRHILQSTDADGIFKEYLGLEHDDNLPNRSSTTHGQRLLTLDARKPELISSIEYQSSSSKPNASGPLSKPRFGRLGRRVRQYIDNH